MDKLTKEQRKVLKDLKNLCDEALKKDTADLVAFAMKFIELGEVFMPNQNFPFTMRGFLESINRFEEKVIGKIAKNKKDNLDYWEKELGKMDKSKKKGGGIDGRRNKFRRRS